VRWRGFAAVMRALRMGMGREGRELESASGAGLIQQEREPIRYDPGG